MSRNALLVLAAVVAAAVLTAIVAFTPMGAAWRRPAPAPVDQTNHVPAPPAPAAGPGAEDPARGEVVIDPRRQQLVGVRVVAVRRTAISEDVRATGIVRVDETRQTEITTKVDGWIRDLRADYTGREIARGETLFTLYSPALLAAEGEYLLAVRGHSQASSSAMPDVLGYSERLHQAARERLLRWDLTDADIREIEERGRAADTVTFRSPVAGTIVEKLAVEGMRVVAGQPLFRVADLSVVWVEADVPEQDLGVVRIGQPAAVTLDAYPDERLAGKTAYVHPTVDEKTRTARVRVQLANRGGRLKPGMFATVELTGRERTGLTVPGDAVLDAGRNQLVFVALGEGRFEPRPVVLGRRLREETEITGGLKEGEQVAAGAAFFLDSESQLRAAARGYQAPPEQAAAATSTPTEKLDIAFRSQPDPPRSGENLVDVTVRDAKGQPVSDADVAVTFFMPAMPSMNMPAMRNEAKLPAAGAGVYRGSIQVMTPGRWDVTVDVRRGTQRLGSRQFAVVAR